MRIKACLPAIKLVIIAGQYVYYLNHMTKWTPDWNKIVTFLLSMLISNKFEVFAKKKTWIFFLRLTCIDAYFMSEWIVLSPTNKLIFNFHNRYRYSMRLWTQLIKFCFKKMRMMFYRYLNLCKTFILLGKCLLFTACRCKFNLIIWPNGFSKLKCMRQKQSFWMYMRV